MLRSVSFLQGLAALPDRLLVVDVGEGTARADHVAFIGGHLAAGALALALSPVALAVPVLPDPAAAVVALFGLGALAIAWLVARTGRLDVGQPLSAVGQVGLVFVGADVTGALASPNLPLLCLPLLAAIATRRRTPVVTVCIALATGIAVLWSRMPATGLRDVTAAAGTDLTLLAILATAALAISIRLSRRRRQQEAERATITRHVETVMEHVSELVTRHAPDGRSLFASPASRRLLGTAPRELLGTGYLDRVHLQDRIAFLRAVSEAAHGGAGRECRLRMRRAGTGSAWSEVDVTIHRVRDYAKRDPQLVVVTRECAALGIEQARAEALEERLRREADTRNRFLATMGHELRTPLNAIIGFAELLESDLIAPLPDERQREHVRLIAQSGDHLLNVVNDLLDASRLEAGRYELDLSLVDMAQEGRACLAMLAPIADKSGIVLRERLAPSLPPVEADSRACRQILINLVSNAIKFSQEGGEVCLWMLQHGRTLRIRVSDNGIGIASDKIGLVGEPFRQLDGGHGRRFAGTGLGLSVVKGLVALHGGEFHIDSAPDRGTTVTVTLPIEARRDRPRPNDRAGRLVTLQSTDKPTAQDEPLAAPSMPNENQDEEGVRHARASA